MKNKEKFAKEILEVACEGHQIAFDKRSMKVCACNSLGCINCAFFNTSQSCTDLIKEWCESEYEEEPNIDWSKVPVDTKVLVRDSNAFSWERRYFAKYEDGKVYTWACGATSWSATCANHWKYAVLAETK